jgi:hypothetical protein
LRSAEKRSLGDSLKRDPTLVQTGRVSDRRGGELTLGVYPGVWISEDFREENGTPERIELFMPRKPKELTWNQLRVIFLIRFGIPETERDTRSGRLAYQKETGWS